MLGIARIAVLSITIGAASIPVSFTINSSPWVVWLGNAIGSLLSAMVVTFIGDRLASERFKSRMNKHRMSRKVVTVFEEGDDNKKVVKARVLINKHGLRIFSFLCPIFPGVLIASVAVYALELDIKLYKRWMYSGIFFASGAYVFGFWYLFVR